MNEGTGTISQYISNDDDPTSVYKPLGYIPGSPVNESDISYTYRDRDYYDSSYSDSTTCYLDVNFECPKYQNGILFFSVSNDTTSATDNNRYVVIRDGKGYYSYSLYDLPSKSRGVEITIMPTLFCKSDFIPEGGFITNKQITITKEEGTYFDSFSGEGEYTLTDKSNCLVLYSMTLESGGDNKEWGKTYHHSIYAKDSDYTISVYDSFDVDEKIIIPRYSVQMFGTVAIISLEEKGNNI